MSPLQKRFRNVIEISGEPVTIGGSDSHALMSPISYSQATVYMSLSELDSATSRPRYGAYTSYDSPGAADDTFEWSGSPLTVRKVMDLRAKGQTVAKLMVLG